MDYVSEFRKYISSHQTSLAVRVTVSVVLPPLIFYYLHNMSIGAALSIGALCTSLTDLPGPPHHRRNGFYASICLNIFMALLVGFTNTWHILLGAEIVLFSFLFSFMSIYGSRAGSVGTMALLVLILTIDSRHNQMEVLKTGLFIGLGGIWYAFLSLVLYTIFPYRLAQQAVGESIISTSRYLAIKARFYENAGPFDDAYTAMMKEQIVLQDQQTQVRELLFKTRRIINDSTSKSRVLLMMFVDSVDLFEMILSSQQDYTFLHEQFDPSPGPPLLPQVASLIHHVADQLEEIGISVQFAVGYKEKGIIEKEIQHLENRLEQWKQERSDLAHLEGYYSLKHILQNIRDILGRIHRLSLYSHYDEQITAGNKGEIDYTRFITHQPIDAQVFLDNLTMRSQAFRHALRLSLAMLVGYIAAQFFHSGHGYWILLSISVILKPIFGSTKRLYFQRLVGTLIGAAIGGVILYYINNGLALMLIMIAFMVIGYSFQKRDYFIYTIFLTIFVLIAFHFLYGHDFREIVKDRVIDTIIGSMIALIAGFILIPSWSQETMFDNMLEMIKANQRYFTTVAQTYIGLNPGVTDFKVARKEAFVALANISDNFQRILSEPRSKQKNVPFMHQFVVSNQMFAAHTASLAYYNENMKEKPVLPVAGLQALVKDVNMHLDKAKLLLEGRSEPGGQTVEMPAENASLDAPDKLKTITDQFDIIHTLSRDIEYAVQKYGPKGQIPPSGQASSAATARIKDAS